MRIFFRGSSELPLKDYPSLHRILFFLQACIFNFFYDFSRINLSRASQAFNVDFPRIFLRGSLMTFKIFFGGLLELQPHVLSRSHDLRFYANIFSRTNRTSSQGLSKLTSEIIFPSSLHL